MDAKPDTTIVIGHNAKNKDEVKSMIENGCWTDFIREVPVHKGDFFFIKPGTVHAIKGGTVILETQQSSDITYRVYDYDRLQDGKPRQLHVWHGKVNGELEINQNQPFLLCSVIEGSCSLDNDTFVKGDHFILPNNYGKAVFKEHAEMILSSI